MQLVKFQEINPVEVRACVQQKLVVSFSFFSFSVGAVRLGRVGRSRFQLASPGSPEPGPCTGEFVSFLGLALGGLGSLVEEFT